MITQKGREMSLHKRARTLITLARNMRDGIVNAYQCSLVDFWIVNERLRLKEFSSFDQEALIGIEISCCEKHKYMLLLIN
ncbi:unnamed protein product [Arabidopsis halleri]